MSDYAANHAEYRVLKDGNTKVVKSMMIQPGDILYLEKGEKAPVDAFILSTSIEDGTCFVDTAELDGETNLKRRTALQEFSAFNNISVSYYRFRKKRKKTAPMGQLSLHQPTLA